MIFYFSGTGNSRHIARHIARLTSDSAQDICNTTLTPTDDTRIGLIFPVHAWHAPTIYQQFIEQKLRNLVCHASPYIYMIATCGDDIGKTEELTTRLLNSIGLQLSAAFSLIMPDSYIGLPGFDVNSEEVELRKVSAALTLLPEIAADINAHRNVRRTKPGPFPWTKSHVLRPLFYKYFTGPRLFSTTDTCIACKRCADICPTKNITFKDRRPQWGDRCTNCLACYHICPKHSIVFGKFSKAKGQYQLLLDKQEV